MPGVLEEGDWTLLMRRIQKGRCTAFIGAGACAGILPLGAEIARAWDQEYHYPLEENRDLAKVGQYIAVKRMDEAAPKELISEYIDKCIKAGRIPDFSDPDEPHAVLADLPLTTYITTNYDDFMTRALKNRMRNPKVELCRWNKVLRDHTSVFETEGFVPTPQQPIVFHLHGHYQFDNSIVVSEEDYLDFLVNIARDESLIPPQIQAALTGNSLLFLGYRLADWDFRVLFSSLVTYMERSMTRAHVSVQLIPLGTDFPQEQRDRAQQYLDEYFGRLRIRVYWGTCREFSAELRRRWKAFSTQTAAGG